MLNFKRLYKSFIYAGRGLKVILVTEQNLRLQALVGVIVFIYAYLLKLARWEWCFLVVAVGLVVLAETINSVVERVVDITQPRLNDYSKEIKDISAAVVVVAAFLAVIIGFFIFGPHLKV
jgi:diacylglycerol kinase